jgi:hypothetical protein
MLLVDGWPERAGLLSSYNSVYTASSVIEALEILTGQPVEER